MRYNLKMLSIDSGLLKKELSRGMSKPWKLPINLTIAALGTLAFIFAGIFVNSFHRGLPYISANIFIWTLATYNASQLGSDSSNVMSYLNKKKSLKEIFIIKNLSLLIIALPIDILLIVLACYVLNDWSSFGRSIFLGLAAVVICLGFGNIVSTLWVYKPKSFLKIRKDRLQLYDYGVFLALSYAGASLALLAAGIMGLILVSTLNLNNPFYAIIAGLIMVIWATSIWLLSLSISKKIVSKYSVNFYYRLKGESIIIKNAKLKRILKV